MSWNSGGISLGQVASQSLNYSTSTAGEVFRFVFWGSKYSYFLQESSNVSHHHHCSALSVVDSYGLLVMGGL